MSSFTHRNEEISIDEAPVFKEKDYTVDGQGKLVYKAKTRFGNAYAPKPDRVLEDAKKMIDENLRGMRCAEIFDDVVLTTGFMPARHIRDLMLVYR